MTVQVVVLKSSPLRSAYENTVISVPL